MKEYVVNVNFAGFYGCDKEYTVTVTDEISESDVIDLAVAEAVDDLSAEVVSEDEVSVNFAGFYGCDEYYTVSEGSEDDMIIEGLEQAEWDLSGEIIECTDVE